MDASASRCPRPRARSQPQPTLDPVGIEATVSSQRARAGEHQRLVLPLLRAWASPAEGAPLTRPAPSPLLPSSLSSSLEPFLSPVSFSLTRRHSCHVRSSKPPPWRTAPPPVLALPSSEPRQEPPPSLPSPDASAAARSALPRLRPEQERVASSCVDHPSPPVGPPRQPSELLNSVQRFLSEVVASGVGSPCRSKPRGLRLLLLDKVPKAFGV